MHDSAMAWGKLQGCDGMSIAGRKGWKRVLEAKGWKEQLTILAKEF